MQGDAEYEELSGVVSFEAREMDRRAVVFEFSEQRNIRRHKIAGSGNEIDADIGMRLAIGRKKYRRANPAVGLKLSDQGRASYNRIDSPCGKLRV